MDGYERGRAAWPGVTLDRASFESHRTALAADDTHAEDLFLALACASGDPAALAAFDARFLSQVPMFISRIDPSPTLAEEIRQILRTNLLVAEAGGRPRIAEYSGRGALGGWIRVIAVRSVHRLQQRKLDRAPSQDALAMQLIAADPNPEMALIKARHGADLAGAIKSAIAALESRDRNLIKLHIVEEMSIGDLCELYGVHRATLFRWLARIKEQLFESATTGLKQRLGLDSAAVDSLCAAVRSQLEVSLSGLAAPSAD